MIRYRTFAIRSLLALSCAALAGCNNASAPVIKLTPTGTQAVDPGQSINFTATDSSMQGVNWALMSFGMLTNVTKTSVTYTAPPAVAAPEMDHLVATSIKDPKKSVTIEIDLSPLPSVTTASLPGGTVGIAYNQTLAASGGAGALTWTVSAGALPAGLTLSSAGAITGTPTGPASATPVSFTVKVTDSSNGGPMSATQPLSILISNPPPPTLTMIAPATGIQGASVNVTLTGTNFVAGSAINVPAGGGITVSGTTVASGTSITATFTIAGTATLGAQNVSVTTAGGTTGTQTFTVKPPPPTLTAIAPPIGVQGTNVNVTLTGTNFVVAGSTINVPAGVGITVSGTNVTSSTTITAMFAIVPTATLGAQNVSVTTAGGTTGNVVFLVKPPPPTLTMISPTSGVQGTSPTVTLTGTNFVVGGSAINVPAGVGITVSATMVTSTTTITATFAIAGTASVGPQNVSVTTAGGTTANQTFTVNPPPPTLTSVSPNSGIQGTNVNVTLTGTNFLGGAIVVTPGTGITVVNTTVMNSTTITAQFQVAAAAPLGAQGVTVITAGGTTASQPFTVAPPPTLTMISPAQGNQSSNAPVTLTGTNFFSPATINFPAGANITATNVMVTSTTTITATFVIAANAPLGNQNISVTSSGVTTSTVMFNVIPAQPTLTSVSPNSGIQNTNVNVTLTGTNFITGSTITVTPGTGIAVVNTMVTSTTTITATFQIAAGAPLGAQGVTVMTAGGTTASQSFTVAAPPTLTSINVTSGDEGANVNVTLMGTNFFTPAMINFSGTGITATNVVVTSTTTITATFVIASNAPLGNQNISVTTSGVTTAMTVAFTVNPPQPTLASLSPAVGAQNTVVNETLTGTNFVAGSSINVPAGVGIAVSNTMVTSTTTITATFTIAAGATLGAHNVSVTTAGGTTGNQSFTVEPPPTLASINPTSGNQGANVPVTLTGTNFVSPATISFNGGTGISANNITVTNATTITATFVIAANAPLGAQNISVTTDGVTTTTVAFTVTAVATSNSKLNGPYAFIFQGWDDPGETPMAIAGRFVADGNGGITGAVATINRATGITGLTSTTGTYTVNVTDNRGTLTLAGIKFKFALSQIATAPPPPVGAAGKAWIIEFDDLTGTSGTRGSGQIKNQDPAGFTAGTDLNSDMAFGLAGSLNGTRLSVAGRFTPDGVSALTLCHLDVSGEGSASGDLTFMGSFSPPNASGHGTMQFTNLTVPGLGGITPNFDYYVVFAENIFIISTDKQGATAPLLSGETKLQQGKPFTAANSLTGPVIFHVAGHDSSQGVASNTAIGRVIPAAPAGSGNISGLIDQHADGAVNASVAFTGTITLDASGNGRGILTFVVNGAGAKPQVIYMVKPNEGYILEGIAGTPGNDATLGYFDPQATGPYTISGSYALGSLEPTTTDVSNLSGVFTTTSATNANGTVDISNGSGTSLKADLGVTFTITGPDALGRGTIIVTPAMGTGTTLIYWVRDSRILFVIDSQVANTNTPIYATNK